MVLRINLQTSRPRWQKLCFGKINKYREALEQQRRALKLLGDNNFKDDFGRELDCIAAKIDAASCLVRHSDFSDAKYLGRLSREVIEDLEFVSQAITLAQAAAQEALMSTNPPAAPLLLIEKIEPSASEAVKYPQIPAALIANENFCSWGKKLSDDQQRALKVVSGIDNGTVFQRLWLRDSLWGDTGEGSWLSQVLIAVNGLMGTKGIKNAKGSLMKTLREMSLPDVVPKGLACEIIILNRLAATAQGRDRLTGINRELGRVNYYSEDVVCNEAGVPYDFEGRDNPERLEEVVVDGYRGKKQAIIEVKYCSKPAGLVFDFANNGIEEMLKFRRQARKYAALAEEQPNQVRAVEYHIVAKSIDANVLEFFEETFEGKAGLKVFQYKSVLDRDPELVWEGDPPSNSKGRVSKTSLNGQGKKAASKFDGEAWKWALGKFSRFSAKKSIAARVANVRRMVRNPEFYQQVCDGLRDKLDEFLAKRNRSEGERQNAEALRNAISGNRSEIIKPAPSQKAIIDFSIIIRQVKDLIGSVN
ncbi:MAG: hypothetical protein KJ811_01775 [Candidatus Margulisbacteria bacterium]|nr:hypothetical protein [Candidatus Margulisiibacteriota bacterium]